MKLKKLQKNVALAWFGVFVVMFNLVFGFFGIGVFAALFILIIFLFGD